MHAVHSKRPRRKIRWLGGDPVFHLLSPSLLSSGLSWKVSAYKASRCATAEVAIEPFPFVFRGSRACVSIEGGSVPNVRHRRVFCDSRSAGDAWRGTRHAMIEELTRPVRESDIRDLARLLVDAVNSGASVSFLAPLSLARAEEWWQETLADGHPRAAFLVARDDQGIVGTVPGVGSEPASPRRSGKTYRASPWPPKGHRTGAHARPGSPGPIRRIH